MFLPRFISGPFCAWRLLPARAASGLLAACLAFVPALRAQRPELVDVKAWRGHFTARANADLSDLPPGILTRFAELGVKPELTVSVRVSAEVILDEYDDTPSTWTGRIVSSSLTARYHCRLDTKDSVIDCDFSTSGPLQPEASDSPTRVVFHADGTWELILHGVKRANTITTVTKVRNPPATFTDIQEAKVYGGSGQDQGFAFPATGFVLRGQGTYGKQHATTGSVPLSPSLKYDVDVYLEPTDKSELKLIIDRPSGYDTWRPTTKGLLNPGEPLRVQAHLETADGSKPQSRVTSFTWKLVDTSREPGAVLNYPVGADDTDYDLKLDAEGGYFSRTDDGQQIERAVERDALSDTVIVDPQDWGGWSTLEVTAKLSDGREVKGKLKGEDDFGVRLPKRSATSKIADGWKKTSGASGDDNADEDNNPEGDKNKGDGFSLYEEYRGFYVDGKHVSGDPKKKELFVRIEPAAGDSVAGVLQFRRITGLNVFHRLLEEEFPASRVMNANRKEGPHVVDQHGVLVKKQPGQVGFAMVAGPSNRPNTPKAIDAVFLPEHWSSSSDSHFIASTVAHELGHAVNLWHHGEVDRQVVWRVQDGKLLEDGRPIRVVNESLEDITDGMVAFVDLGLQPGQTYLRMNLGVKQGQHSGFEDCVMRYDCAQVYLHPTDPGLRISEFVEKTGDFLCTSAAGSGVNAADRTPFPRYSDAARSRGDCLHQILVNDAVAAPAR